MSFASRLFATTNVDKLREMAAKGRILKRALTAKDLIAIGLGTMIGGGIFTTIGTGVKGAGPAVIISYLLAGVTSFFAALCYAELGAMVPIAGSAYTYAYATIGKLFAWIIGFALIFEYGISAAPVAQQFSAAIQDVFKSIGFALPQWAQESNLVINGPWWVPGSWDLVHSQCDIVGALFVLGLSGILSVGIRESATANNIFVVLKISALAVFIVAGALLFHAYNLHNFNPMGWGKLTPFGGMADYSSSAQPYGIVAIGAYVFFSYIGFDTATTTAEECKNPQWDVPVGVIGALAIGTVIYCATAIILVGAVPWQQVPIKNPLVYRARATPSALAQLGDHDGRAGWNDQRRAEFAARPNAHLLRHGARQDASAGRREGKSALPDARRHDDGNRHRRRGAYAHRAAQPVAQHGEYRNVDRVHGRLRRRALSAQAQAEHEAQRSGFRSFRCFRSSGICARCSLRSSASRA